jgi:hypothetical protein
MRNGLKTFLFCAVMAIVWSNTGVGAASPVTRSYSAGRFALEIDGSVAGFVNAVEGGQAFGEVVKEAPGDDVFFKKHLGNPGFHDIRLEFGADMDKSFYNWIVLALQGQHFSLNGAIVGVDFNGNVISRLEFQHAQITEVGFPALDAASKDTGRMSIVLSPDQTVLNRKASGKLSVKSSVNQKKWLTSSFRLSIDGLDTKKVSKIDALTVKIPRIYFGDGSEVCLHCDLPPDLTRLDFPHLVVTIGEPAESLYDWFERFVIEGNNDDSQEKGGTLEYLATDLKTVLFTVKLRNLGIFELMPVVDEGSALPRLVAAMYCESMELVVP